MSNNGDFVSDRHNKVIYAGTEKNESETGFILGQYMKKYVV